MAQPLTPDEQQGTITRESALAIGEWLEGSGILEKRIRHLTLAELDCMAVAALSQAVVTRGETGGGRASGAGTREYIGLAPCSVCGFEGRGFGFQLDSIVRPNPTAPHYEFCSRLCQHIAARTVNPRTGVIAVNKLTDMEKQAIFEARRSLAETLEKLGLMAPFHDRSATEIDQIIEACWRGCQASMWRQSERGIIPL